jgi:hypothetical protein
MVIFRFANCERSPGFMTFYDGPISGHLGNSQIGKHWVQAAEENSPPCADLLEELPLLDGMGNHQILIL